MTKALAEQDRARGGIRAFVERSGTRLKGATPTGMVAALVAAACTPAVSALFGQTAFRNFPPYLKERCLPSAFPAV